MESSSSPVASCLTTKSWSKLQQSKVLRTLLVGLLFVFGSCKAKREEVMAHGPTMGTTWNLTCVNPSNLSEAALTALVQTRLDELENMFSNWRPETAVSRFNASRSTDWQPVPREFAEVALFAQQLSRETHGAFDVTAARLIDLWGFGARSRVSAPPTDASIANAKEHCGWEKLEVKLDPPMVRKSDPDLRINLSALVEGYAVDDLVKRLRAQKIDRFLLDVGGEIFASGTKQDGSAWQVGVQRPDAEKGAIVGSMPLRDKALATSGTYNQFFEHDSKRYAHLLDARTGRPIEHATVSVSVTANACFTADGWATALLIVGSEEGRRLAERQGVSVMFLTAPVLSR